MEQKRIISARLTEMKKYNEDGLSPLSIFQYLISQIESKGLFKVYQEGPILYAIEERGLHSFKKLTMRGMLTMSVRDFIYKVAFQGVSGPKLGRVAVMLRYFDSDENMTVQEFLNHDSKPLFKFRNYGKKSHRNLMNRMEEVGFKNLDQYPMFACLKK